MGAPTTLLNIRTPATPEDNQQGTKNIGTSRIPSPFFLIIKNLKNAKHKRRK